MSDGRKLAMFPISFAICLEAKYRWKTEKFLLDFIFNYLAINKFSACFFTFSRSLIFTFFYCQLTEVKVTLRKYMDLEGDARKLKEHAEKELRETQIRLAGLEDVDVKQLKNQIRTLQRQVLRFSVDMLFVNKAVFYRYRTWKWRGNPLGNIITTGTFRLPFIRVVKYKENKHEIWWIIIIINTQNQEVH